MGNCLVKDEIGLFEDRLAALLELACLEYSLGDGRQGGMTFERKGDDGAHADQTPLTPRELAQRPPPLEWPVNGQG
jgi:hypothetical protein